MTSSTVVPPIDFICEFIPTYFIAIKIIFIESTHNKQHFHEFHWIFSNKFYKINWAAQHYEVRGHFVVTKRRVVIIKITRKRGILKNLFNSNFFLQHFFVRDASIFFFFLFKLDYMRISYTHVFFFFII